MNTMYDRPILRSCKCWRCALRGAYEWRTPRWHTEKIPHSKKMYCNKTKRWGSTTRAYWCKYFVSNSNSYRDSVEKSEN